LFQQLFIPFQTNPMRALLALAIIFTIASVIIHLIEASAKAVGRGLAEAAKTDTGSIILSAITWAIIITIYISRKNKQA